MKRILAWLGYRERTNNVIDVLRDACQLNVEMNNRIEKMKATLNGEEFWFTKGKEHDRDDE